MNKLDLLKKLLPGLLPLLIFIIADEIWGTEIGLMVAVAFGVGEIIYAFIQKRKPDKFVLLDVGLLIALGLVSIFLENDLFFKLKPGVIGIIFCSMLGVSVYSGNNLILGMSQRYMGDVQINPWQQMEMTQSIKGMFWIFVGHTIAVFVAAFAMSKEVWVFISGPGFYIVFGLFMALEWLRKKQSAKRYATQEWLPIVDKTGKVLGQMPREIAHKKTFILHPVIHLHVMNKKGVFLQKRSRHKLIQPGKWDTAVGGHIGAGETIAQSLQREAFEEIGFSDFRAQSITAYEWKSEVERELVSVFTTEYNQQIDVTNDEVDECRFWSWAQLEESMGTGVFTPNFEYEYQTVLKQLKNEDLTLIPKVLKGNCPI